MAIELREYGYLQCKMGVPMAMGRPKAQLVLRPEQREQLEGLASSRSLPAGLVSRARIILLTASPASGISGFPKRDREERAGDLGCAPHRGQLRYPQTSASKTLVRPTATLSHALHSDVCLVAESSGDVVQPDYTTGDSSVV